MSEDATTTPNNAVADATEDTKDTLSPARQLNANAKSFVPRLETKSAPSAKPSVPASSKPAPQSSSYAPTMPPPPPPLGMPLYVPPMSGFIPPMPLGYPPQIMSPLLLAAMANNARFMVPPTPPATNTQAAPAPPPAATPLAASAPQTPLNVNVGNASLQALRAGGPAKFACVLIVGMPRVGKTTIGRNLVSQLEKDGLAWSFFSGGDYIKDGLRSTPWDTLKEIFDALALKIDELQSRSTPIKGLIIDKQCRGTEELYYLTALLRAKNLQLNGVVGLVADDDEKLMARLGEEDQSFKEKCKFHRVIQTRIREACKGVGLWHPVDALEDADTVVRKVRSMVLGCSSQAPHKQLTANMYNDSQNVMVDSYEVYAQTMNTLTGLTRLPKPTHFPGFTSYVPLSTQALSKKAAFKEYAIRRRTDGAKYVLLYDGSKMFIVPRHMRCVFHVRPEAWLGTPLHNVSKFVLDGDLMRLSKERNREKFLVQDVLCFIEKGSTMNLLARATWKERQEKLKIFLCGEESAFFGSNSDVVIVHQTFVDFKNASKLLEPCDYPTDGFVFHPIVKRDDPVYFWRPPESVSVDFRLGPVVATGEGAKKYSLQVYDTKLAKFVAYGQDTTTISDTRQFVVEGALALCTVKPEEITKLDGREWNYVRTRMDIPTCAFKSYVDDLLENCLIPKAAVYAFMGVDPTLPRPVATTQSANTPGSTPPPPPPPPQHSMPQQNAACSVAPSNAQQRGTFGSALVTDAPVASIPSQTSTITALSSVVSNVHHVTGNGNSATPATAYSTSRKPRGPTATETSSRHDRAPRRRESPPQSSRKQRCWDCHNVGEGEIDSGDHQFYCLDCWAKFEKAAAKKSRRNGGKPHDNATAPSADERDHRKTRRGGTSKRIDSGTQNSEREAEGASVDATLAPDAAIPVPEAAPSS